MTTILRYGARARGRRLLLLFCAAAALAVPGATRVADAAVTCPSSNPIVNENVCIGGGTSAWDLNNYSENIAGFATQTSFNKGTAVPLKIGRNATPSSTSVNIAVYRMGFYGDLGGRLVNSRNNVVVNNNLNCKPMDTVTGKYDCSNWNVTYTIPASSLPASGVYVVKLTTTDSAHLENQIVFVYRDDNRVPESKILFVLPTATWQAYNNWGGKSLYFDKNGGANTVAGTPRAVKVSFDRPLDNNEADQNRFIGPDFYLLAWMERASSSSASSRKRVRGWYGLGSIRSMSISCGPKLAFSRAGTTAAPPPVETGTGC